MGWGYTGNDLLQSGAVAVADVKIAEDFMVEGDVNPCFEGFTAVIFAGNEATGAEEDVNAVDFARDAQAGDFFEPGDGMILIAFEP